MKNFLKLKVFPNKHRNLLYIILFITMSCVSIIQSIFYGNVEADPKVKSELENTIYLKTDLCDIKIKLLPNVAPNHVKNIKELARKKFYDGLLFHRVIKGFMVQAGGKVDNMNYGSNKKIKAEFSKMKHVRGVVSMARSMDPDSASSQFFIVTQDSPFLDGQYSIFGIVSDGMDCVDKIKIGDPNNNGYVNNPTKIKSIKVAIDAEIENAKSTKK